MAVKLWWMIHKDLVSECRGRHAWPAMVLLGVVVVLVFAIHTDLPDAQKDRLAGGLLWLAIFFAGTIALDRSFGMERDDGCLEALRLYPTSGSVIYLSKLVVNVVVLSCLECVLIPLFFVLTGVRLLAHPWALLLVAWLGNLGLAAVGTLLGAVTSGVRRRGNLLALLVLPMAFPVISGTAAATRLMVASDFGAEWWRWLQLLGAFAVVFITAGVVLFDFVIED